jgi:predicted branched-subunit amino acid permease
MSHVPSAITPRGEFETGLRLALPLLPGTAAWGLVAGVAMIKAGLTVPQATAMTLLMYAGSAQLACMPLIAAGAPLGVMVLTAGVVNLRFLIYGIGLAPAFRGESVRQKLVLGYLNTDLGFVLFVPRRREEPDRPHARSLYLGIAAGNWVAWQIPSFIGIALASRIPTDWGLELAGALALLALAIPLLDTIAAIVGAAIASAVGLAAIDWPMRLGIIAAIFAGVAAAMLTEALLPSRKRPTGSSASVDTRDAMKDRR